jgi:hypothetical protein
MQKIYHVWMYFEDLANVQREIVIPLSKETTKRQFIEGCTSRKISYGANRIIENLMGLFLKRLALLPC